MHETRSLFLFLFLSFLLFTTAYSPSSSGRAHGEPPDHSNTRSLLCQLDLRCTRAGKEGTPTLPRGPHTLPAQPQGSPCSQHTGSRPLCPQRHPSFTNHPVPASPHSPDWHLFSETSLSDPKPRAPHSAQTHSQPTITRSPPAPQNLHSPQSPLPSDPSQFSP